jgi:hypothetical protein
MHKKLEAELVSLAHSILELKNNDVTILHKKAHTIYEKLTILKFVEENLNSLENVDEVNNEVEKENKTVIKQETIAAIVAEEPATVKTVESIIEVAKELEKDVTSDEEKAIEFSIEDTPITQEETPINTKEIIEERALPKATLEEEFKDAISADVATNLFEKATKENPVIEENKQQSIRSINDTLFKSNLQIGLNDRIAFVKHLFEGSQEDFNRVLSQLNSFKTEKEAKDFLNNLVKPDYNWTDKAEYEVRLVDLIERKFL